MTYLEEEFEEASPEVVAILDDNPDDVLFLSRQLQTQYSILKFTDLAKFRIAMSQTNADVLILDYRIHDDGENCLKIIREYKSRIPIIMVVTGMYSLDGVVTSCYKAGASTVLDKNNPDEIKRQIVGLWRSRTMLIKRKETQAISL